MASKFQSLRTVSKYRSIENRFRAAKKSIKFSHKHFNDQIKDAENVHSFKTRLKHVR